MLKFVHMRPFRSSGQLISVLTVPLPRQTTLAFCGLNSPTSQLRSKANASLSAVQSHCSYHYSYKPLFYQLRGAAVSLPRPSCLYPSKLRHAFSNFPTKQDAQPVEEEGTSSVHYTCPGIAKPNVYPEVHVPRMPAAGASASFYIQVNKLETSREMKFAVLEDPQLRWSRRGKRADWIVQIGRRRKRLGSSKILPGSGMHSVTVVSGKYSVTVLEDGKVIGSWRREKETISRAFEMQVCTKDTQLDIDVTGIQVHGDFNEAVYV